MEDKDKTRVSELNKNGFSLVEVIVSMALLVVVATILLTGVMTAGAINSRSVDLTRAGYNQATLLEETRNSPGSPPNGVTVEHSSLTVTIPVGDQEVFGYYMSVPVDDSGFRFYLCVPDVINGEQPPSGSSNTPTQFLVGDNNARYVVKTYNGINGYLDGTAKNIPKNTIIYEPARYTSNGDFIKEGYYMIRYGTGWISPPVNDQTIYNLLCKSPQDGFTIDVSYSDGNNYDANYKTPTWEPPEKRTKAGDIKKVDEGGNIKFYVFWPTYYQPHSIYDDDLWRPIYPSLIGS